MRFGWEAEQAGDLGPPFIRPWGASLSLLKSVIWGVSDTKTDALSKTLLLIKPPWLISCGYIPESLGIRNLI